jgi:MerR family transcriptional regulator, light-induced transcriptional regulator
MEEVRYMISEASKRIDVEAHVLRYWEEELELPISRNEMGQRYYKETDIELLKKIKHLKEQGFQLKAVKMLLPNLNKPDSLDSQTMIGQNEEQDGKVIEMFQEEKITETEEGTSMITGEEKHEVKEQSEDKMGQFKAIMNHIILSALKENNGTLSEEISMNVTDGVIKEMNYLMRLQEEKEEERYKKFDASLRDYQKSRMMAAATLDGKNKRKSKFFKKNKIYL